MLTQLSPPCVPSCADLEIRLPDGWRGGIGSGMLSESALLTNAHCPFSPGITMCGLLPFTS
jgi:hypothetical protein